MHGTVGASLIRRTFDPTFLNTVANDPAVHPSLGTDDAIDLGSIVADAGNIALQSDFGGFVLTKHEPGVYEVHSLFLPGHKGHPAQAMRAAQEWVFTRSDCSLIYSKVPKSNERAKGFAVAGGLRTLFERDDARLGPCEYAELDVMRWAMGNADLEQHGEAFHAALEAAKAAKGSTLPTHPHDSAHERAAGAASLMFQRGQPVKAAALYNRWARFAGYAEINLVSLAPLVLDTGDAVVGLGDDGMEVLLCR